MACRAMQGGAPHLAAAHHVDEAAWRRGGAGRRGAGGRGADEHGAVERDAGELDAGGRRASEHGAVAHPQPWRTHYGRSEKQLLVLC